MEGEHKVDLPLNGELDIKSSDMLVPINQAKFAHNRQRWQGHVLPSSLRYEHDGWAAGWDVYDIHYDVHDIDTEVAGVKYKIRRYYYNDNRAYKVVVLDADDVIHGSFIYNESTVTSDGITVAGGNDGVYHITADIGDSTVTFDYNILTNELSNYNATAFAISADITENARLTLNVVDKNETVKVDIERLNTPTTMYAILDADNEIVLGQFVSFVNNEYTWRNIVYSVVLSKNGSTGNYTLNITYNDEPITNPIVVTPAMIDNGVLKGVSFTLSATATVSYTGTCDNMRIDKITNISSVTGSKDISICTSVPNWNKDYTFNYTKLYDEIYWPSSAVRPTVTIHEEPAVAKKSNKLSNTAYTEFTTDKITAYIPCSIGIAITYDVHIVDVSGGSRRRHISNADIKVYENDIDVTDKYTVTNDSDTLSLYTNEATLLRSKNSRAAALSVYREVLEKFSTAFDSTNAVLADTYLSYYGIRESFDDPILPCVWYYDSYAADGVRDAVNCKNIDGNIRNVYFEHAYDTSPGDHKGVLRFNIIQMCPVSSNVSFVGNEVVLTPTNEVGTLNHNSINLFDIVADKSSTSIVQGTFIGTTNTAFNYSVVPVTAVTLYLLNNDANKLHLPFTPALYGAANSYVTPVTITNGVTNTATQEGGEEVTGDNYIQGYNLLDMLLQITGVGAVYCSTLTASYTMSRTNKETELSNKLLPDVLSNILFTIDSPTEVDSVDDTYTQSLVLSIPGVFTSDRYTVTATGSLINFPRIECTFKYKGIDISVVYNGGSSTTATVVGSSGNANATAVYAIEDTALPYVQGNTVTEANSSIIKFTYNGKEYAYDYISNTVYYNDKDINNVSVSAVDIDEYYALRLSFELSAAAKYSVMLKGPTLFKDMSATQYNTDTLSLNNGIVIDIAGLLEIEESTATVTVTDIRDADNSEHDIHKINSNNVLQIIKQQWNTTTEVESYWWLNAEHILVQNDYNFTVLHKCADIDCWNGDKWEVLHTYSVTDYIDSDTVAYGCTSAYADTALLYTVYVHSDREIVFNFYNILTGAKYTKSLFINIVQLGDKLLSSSTDTIDTYTAITAPQLMSAATISATVRDGNIILGIHYDNNFNQWTFIINSTADTIGRVHGYGFVSVDGSLTGGELPYKYFDAVHNNMGFNSTVHDIKLLNKKREAGEDKDYVYSVADLFNVNERVVGTADRQWYINKNVDSIVSHLTYSNGAFTPVRLYLNNNYETVYASGSFAAQVLGESASIKVDRLYNLLNNTGNISFKSIFDNANNTKVKDVPSGGKLVSDVAGWTFAAFTDFNIFSYAPILSCINYVQQTIGQYAYVHYNSSDITVQHDIISELHSDTPEDFVRSDMQQTTRKGDADKVVSTVSSDELAFDTQIVRQAQSCEAAWPASFITIIAIAQYAIDRVSEKMQLNGNNNQTTIAGQNTVTQLYAQALNSFSLSDLQVRKPMPTQLSEVPAIKTLDMFYSTSSAQQIYAGPGFVNHNFVAQCAAQSVTSLQLELQQQQLQWIIKIMTTAIQKALAALYRNLADTINGLAELYSGHYIVGSFIKGISWAFAAAAGIAESKLDMMETILNALGGDAARMNIRAAMSKHTYDVEGKHRYGSSSKAFMWPCFGCSSNGTYTDEYVAADAQNKTWYLNAPTATNADIKVLMQAEPNADINNIAPFVTSRPDTNLVKKFTGNVNYFISMCKGDSYTRDVPKDMAYIIGVESFLSKDMFKNDTIGESEPVFGAPLIQDYMLSEQWELGATATAGAIAWVSVRDTKIIDGAPSNIVISPDFCGVASTYTAIEVKRGITEKYMRPVTITPSAVQFNCTNFNCAFESKMYHAFDGYGYRIVNWVGSTGMNKEKYTLLYAFIKNDRFKRSNKTAPNQLLGDFKSSPVLDMPINGDDRLHIQVTVPTDNKGLAAGVPGEDKDILRYALPVHTEYVNTLPAAVKTLRSYTLSVVEGITSLCTDLRNAQTVYKLPVSVDFNIGAQLYRATQEYICKLTNQNGAVASENLVPILGLTFIGASPYEAYFYSQATRLYYVYTGGTEITAIDTIERFRDVKNGYWDFVNQEVVMPCVATFDRLDSKVKDDSDETDNIIIPVIKNGAYRGEVPPPVTTIFDTESWFKTYSLPSGVVFQGPRRCIINRFVWSDYMLQGVLANRGKWKKVPREEYHPFRQYDATDKISGWTHNPFLLVTAPLGINEETDCKFEWEITFAWTVEMDKLYTADNYACVNVIAETMEPGGKVYSRPTHIFLTKDLFTRSGNYGYYSFRYQSNNGIGNRERLHIWADSYIAVSSVQCAYKEMTTRRTEILTQQVDIKGLKEM